MNAKFTEISAAADYIGPGAIEVPMYQTEILDLVRRRGVFGQRIKQVPATGHPSRFFEETAIPSPAASAGFVDPRNIVAPVVQPTRVERSVPLKALVAQINYNLFDLELGKQQSQFAYLQAKDLTDTVDGVLRTHDVALWNGTDTSLSSPTTAQYFGAAGQIAAGGNTTTIGTSQSIVDGLKSTIAQMLANTSYRRAADGDLCEPGAAGPDRSRDEGGVQRGAEHQADRGRLDGEDAEHAGGRYSADSGVDAAVHGHAGFGLGGAAGVHRDGRPDRVPLAGRSESAGVPAGPAGIAGEPVCRGEVRRRGGEGRELCALPGAGGSLEADMVGRSAVGASASSPGIGAGVEREKMRWDICCRRSMRRMG